MKTWNVTIPFAGHLHKTVDANTKEEAIEAAMHDASLEDVESWECYRKFHSGNVCHIDKPWEVETQED